MPAVLENAGHEVLEAANAEDALEILEASPPDGMLLDIRLPGMDGWDVLRFVQGRDDLRLMKVIVCSAHADANDRSRARSEGAGASSQAVPDGELVGSSQRPSACLGCGRPG